MADKSAVTIPEKAITLTKRGWIAIITIDVPAKLNALTQQCYFRIASLLHEIAAMDDITVTIITGKGRFFSAGADVTSASGPSDSSSSTSKRAFYNQGFVANNLHNTHAWYTHPKILITALNGPAVGISAANTAHSDFVYAAPHAYLLTPFTSLGLVAEGGSSAAFVERLGVSKAKEALIMSKRLGTEELVRCGYVNKVFEEGGGDQGTGKGIDSDKFLTAVVQEIEDRFDPAHLNHYAILKMKSLVKKPTLATLDRAGLDEVWGGLDVFMKGTPQKEFARMASGEKRHKL